MFGGCLGGEGGVVNKGTDLLLCTVIASLKKSIKISTHVIDLSPKHTITLSFSEQVKVREHVNCLEVRVLRNK